jgi:DNA-directed RNA polymerase alpha subunit
MDPQIINPEENEGILKFTLRGVNVSIANGLRRIILSNIPTYVFKTTPHDKNQSTFHINTTRMNNELIKQRLSCIPIHIKLSEKDFPYKDYVLEIKEKNDTNKTVYITTENFKIKNKETGKYITKAETQRMFPFNSLTGNYIEFVRLRSKLSEDIPGEQLHLTCNFDIGTSEEDGMFNVVSTCSYAFTPNKLEQNKKWAAKEAEVKSTMSGEELDMYKQNWKLLEEQRFTIPDSFDFIIESVGVYENMEIVINACEIMIYKLNKFVEYIQAEDFVIQESNTTIPNSYDIIFKNEGYTLGKVIEYFLYSKYFKEEKLLSYCGFRKPHPHIDESLLRIAYHNELEDKSTVNIHLLESAEKAKIVFEKILKEMSPS